MSRNLRVLNAMQRELDSEILSIATSGEAEGGFEAKGIKTMDAKQAEESSAENEPGKDISATARALGTDEILRWIFKNLPTGFLLSSCGLVNKFCNAKARSFIWTNRKCTLTKSMRISNCQFLREVDELCSQMTANGRKIPFNCLRLLSFPFSVVNCSQDLAEGEVAGDVGKQLEIKHLEAFQGGENSDCSVHQPLRNLLSQDSRSRLQILQIENVPLFGETLRRSGLDHEFPRLQQLSLNYRYSYSYLTTDDLSASKETVARFLELAPNLKEISAPNASMLEIVPKDKYKLLRDLYFSLERSEDMQLLPSAYSIHW